jgi:membrane protein YqaA with SNARE-associated domain
MKFVLPLLHFIFHLGYFGPFVMGVLDSSFLVLPFGNDLVVVGLVAQNHKGFPWYVLLAATGSTCGALLLALVARKLGEEGIQRLAGKKRYDKMKNRVGTHSGVAIALAGLAPPPFPFTTVIAAAAALNYSLWRLLTINFFARAIRFTLLSILALKFGRQILNVAKSAPFEWGMAGFIGLCVIASAFSIIHWLRKPR